MSNKTYGTIGIAIPIIFGIVYFMVSSLHPNYSMFTKAISELGAVGAPNKWIWNSFGYILPGILISIFALGLYKSVAIGKSYRLPFYGIFFSGIFMVMSGVFPGDFDNQQSSTMLLHSIGSFGSYLFFLIGAFTFPKLMDKTNYWKSAKQPTLILTYLTILFGGWVFVFPNMPALGQRFVFLFYFLWIGYTAFRLFKAPTEKPIITGISKNNDK
ncbi:DUF998 domain-containing protein [Muriicola sp. Z0-33]|uniref:DUF998 domain-containing protein n=1 Tax=Muriicola sp. Z0-33 TaxID=2816957 RepID=UPI0022378196|nr:DUF998 domain-containing protein [Muriicola sp. Z0-33]MCW5517878.1 DUF998 domain-containing protein [Muriicola sp. Z0-33]